ECTSPASARALDFAAVLSGDVGRCRDRFGSTWARSIATDVGCGLTELHFECALWPWRHCHGAPVDEGRDRKRRVCGWHHHRSRSLSHPIAREQQVMMLVTSGKMNEQVAGDLGLGEITVNRHSAAVQNGRPNAGGPGPHGGRLEPKCA